MIRYSYIVIEIECEADCSTMQIMALMSLYDPECRGTVAMDDLIVELAKRC